jgi:hypothetical protein
MMNAAEKLGLKTIVIAFVGWLFLGLGAGNAPALSTTELLEAWSNLSSSEQSQIQSILSGTSTDSDSTTSTDTSTDTDSDSGDGEPLGTDAITYVRTGSPGSQVDAAIAGKPINPITVYPIDLDEEPSLWDRVKEVLINSLEAAFENVTGIPVGTLTAKAVDEDSTDTTETSGTTE